MGSGSGLDPFYFDLKPGTYTITPVTITPVPLNCYTITPSIPKDIVIVPGATTSAVFTFAASCTAPSWLTGVTITATAGNSQATVSFPAASRRQPHNRLHRNLNPCWRRTNGWTLVPEQPPNPYHYRPDTRYGVYHHRNGHQCLRDKSAILN